MKKILLTNNDLPTVNIGDYTQSLAAKQFFDDDNYILVNRDELKLYRGEKAKAVLNAWFTYKPENFPPSLDIRPLFVSFHLNTIYGKSILNKKEVVEYFKKYEPIGCRDKKTVDLLQEKGVNAYFSSCLTTTLGLKYKSKRSKRSNIYIVDPMSYMPSGNSFIEILKALFQYIANFKSVNKIIRNYKINNSFSLGFNKIGIGRLLLTTKSYMLLKNIISKELLEKSIFITQFHKTTELKTDKERFHRAEELLFKFADARLVITSRIHCALPCLGLDTPVVFLQNEKDLEKSRCRLGGLIDFFNVIQYRNTQLSKTFLPNNELLNAFNLPKCNKDLFKKYAISLENRVKQFFYDK